MARSTRRTAELPVPLWRILVAAAYVALLSGCATISTTSTSLVSTSLADEPVQLADDQSRIEFEVVHDSETASYRLDLDVSAVATCGREEVGQYETVATRTVAKSRPARVLAGILVGLGAGGIAASLGGFAGQSGSCGVPGLDGSRSYYSSTCSPAAPIVLPVTLGLSVGLVASPLLGTAIADSQVGRSTSEVIGRFDKPEGVYAERGRCNERPYDGAVTVAPAAAPTDGLAVIIVDGRGSAVHPTLATGLSDVWLVTVPERGGHVVDVTSVDSGAAIPDVDVTSVDSGAAIPDVKDQIDPEVESDLLQGTVEEDQRSQGVPAAADRSPTEERDVEAPRTAWREQGSKGEGGASPAEQRATGVEAPELEIEEGAYEARGEGRRAPARPGPNSCPENTRVAGRRGKEQWCKELRGQHRGARHGPYLRWGDPEVIVESGNYLHGMRMGEWTRYGLAGDPLATAHWIGLPSESHYTYDGPGFVEARPTTPVYVFPIPAAGFEADYTYMATHMSDEHQIAWAAWFVRIDERGILKVRTPEGTRKEPIRGWRVSSQGAPNRVHLWYREGQMLIQVGYERFGPFRVSLSDGPLVLRNTGGGHVDGLMVRPWAGDFKGLAERVGPWGPTLAHPEGLLDGPAVLATDEGGGKAAGTFARGLRHRVWIRTDSAGKVRSVKVYDFGVEIGLMRSWDSEGSLAEQAGDLLTLAERLRQECETDGQVPSCDLVQRVLFQLGREAREVLIRELEDNVGERGWTSTVQANAQLVVAAQPGWSSDEVSDLQSRFVAALGVAASKAGDPVRARALLELLEAEILAQLAPRMDPSIYVATLWESASSSLDAAFERHSSSTIRKNAEAWEEVLGAEWRSTWDIAVGARLEQMAAAEALAEQRAAAERARQERERERERERARQERERERARARQERGREREEARSRRDRQYSCSGQEEIIARQNGLTCRAYKCVEDCVREKGYFGNCMTSYAHDLAGCQRAWDQCQYQCR